ncbi:potassium channel family protein [Alloalcanivorax xenomutans]|jgi:trk/ktr system potassium uptake protein|uniref:TrkA family potassium uptake protein n=1 Tax=Alloalcanivorax xenomutans TaxID=1094342 RepID=A0A9Q3W0X1_9GAMM|nr:TrkA family potassium uptake protein [Alloalcanivorax xenomutans]ERS15236.1 potassium transporter TrkA [Alcanivorax sp. PN-3]KYZ86804.1 potassium transporter TrkA [Alcanivorax sp. KX64203]MBA4722370.1 TrkA family potassium uptake protein [Alcanivorax sp.]ARB44648.1 potassium transporter TrkA [Alloalcanivorax xenomutans]MCE7507266.1 TrkA family potassium uptake protein [Alloalcanivorax xenomutans]|tara:strand:- start:2263 stop:2913 length:651 start_codon:yes stop_codon:yes gene_type:complete
MKKQFAVLGLGSFGEAVALELMRLGHQVLGVDNRESQANRLVDKLTQTVIADATDEDALRELDLPSFDAVLVAIGEHIEASILCTMAVKSLEAKEVWVKAITPVHHRIVEKLGADRVLHPEYEMGLRAAQTMAHPNMLDYISLGDNYFVIEIRPGEVLEDRPLSDLKIEEIGVRLLAIKHGQNVDLQPSPHQRLKRNDHLVLLGEEPALRRFSESL